MMRTSAVPATLLILQSHSVLPQFRPSSYIFEMASVVVVTSDAHWKELTGTEKICVVDFYADWCGPCKMISPKFVDFSLKFTSLSFLKVDVDKLENVAADCSIKAMPTFQIWQNGAKLDEVVGASPEKLLMMIETAAAKVA